jgi:hypothetical protein
MGQNFASYVAQSPDGDLIYLQVDADGNLKTVLEETPSPTLSSYVSCPASETTALGGTGAEGDILQSVIVIPGSLSPGDVQIKDGSGSAVTIFAGGATTLTDISSFTLNFGPAGAPSKTGGWSIVCGANVTAIAVGQFA